ncbi:ADP-ribosylation factor GTPase-activating protein 3 [Halyomorpha halys]|uniref:ADP-ribosylation factor GTPase-activating protein 3 n=1 Tax=Halyomorpha halys TaxID=286706 RepID=UPI0006D50C3B|nr:ADP-ribosylation factor GTPase-activating protein 3 [Halyomorpha halys]
MDLYQPLPSSCYLNTSKNTTVVKSNQSSLSPKLQRRKQRLHLGAKRVDPSLFLMLEKENEKKILTDTVNDKSYVEVRKTFSKSVSTEEQDSEEEGSNISKHESNTHESYLLQSRSEKVKTAEHCATHSVSRDDCYANANEQHADNLSSYHQTFKNGEPIKPKFSPCNTDEAQKKFGSAKSISSERYFSDIEGPEKYKSDLSRFTNCSAISSDDLFNRESQEPNLEDLFLTSVDSISYEELAACLKNGVTKVAGKLGSALSSFASRIPHDFGEY